MFLFGLLAAAQEYALIRIILGAAAGILIYFWVTLSLFNTTKQKIVILSVTVYALNYVLAIAVPFSIIILLGLNT